LGDIVEKAEQAQLEPPTTIVIGPVVRLREQLNWFETRPLFGKRVLVTRAKEQAGELSQLIRGYGGDPIECPTIQVVPPASWKELDDAIAELSLYHWLVFTSVNGVRPFMDRLRHRGLDGRALAGLKLCCIGPRTAEELARQGLQADLIPSEFQAEGVIEALRTAGIAGKRVLIPRAAVAREILPEQLRALGAEVRVVTVYRTVLPSVDAEQLKGLFRQGEIHVVTFASSSTVRNFCRLFKNPEEMKEVAGRSAVACIGPITAQTVAEAGLSVAILPDENTIPALADAIVRYCSRPVSAARGA
jgi:uroporphyrinogen III methyltransferase/synthase